MRGGRGSGGGCPPLAPGAGATGSAETGVTARPILCAVAKVAAAEAAAAGIYRTRAQHIYAAPLPYFYFGRAVKGKYTLRALDGNPRSLFDRQ